MSSVSEQVSPIGISLLSPSHSAHSTLMFPVLLSLVSLSYFIFLSLSFLPSLTQSLGSFNLWFQTKYLFVLFLYISPHLEALSYLGDGLGTRDSNSGRGLEDSRLESGALDFFYDPLV